MVSIKEMLKMQPLTEEEKASRHILGRLYGPIATSKESTRNGRKYNAELWNKATTDDIFKEKVATKSLFLELGHPLDGREETDMEKVCACIPEMPKIIDGDLYAYVDILDTKNGRLLKTLCDYGFVPGISSRGSGDVDINDEVDPETFYLETFDIVALPAVKKARLTMCEQLDEKSMKLKKALTESLNAASAEDRKIMKEALNNLNININEELNLDDIPERPKYIDELEASAKLNEAAEEAEDEEVEETPVEEAEETPEEQEKPEEAEKEAAEEESNESETPTIKDFVGQFSEFDENLPIEFKPISIEGKEYVVNEFSLDDSEKGKLVIEIGYDSEMNDNIEKAEGEEAPVDEATEEEAVEEPEEVNDVESDELVESLKEVIRQKEELEKEVRVLNNEKTVRDAEVEKLKEDINTYRISLKKVYGVAKTASSLSEKVKSLTEELDGKNKQLKSLEESNSKALNESITRNSNEVKSLKESLFIKEKEVEEVSKQAASYKSKLIESVKLAKASEERCNKLLEAYISFRAEMLGVRVAEIKNRLDENCSIEQIDKVCDKILTENVGSPAYFNEKTKVVINKPVDPKSNDE